MAATKHLWAVGFEDTGQAEELRDRITRLGRDSDGLNLKDVAVVVVDESPSMRIGQRRKFAEDALEEVTQKLKAFKDIDLRVVHAGAPDANAPMADTGTCFRNAKRAVWAASSSRGEGALLSVLSLGRAAQALQIAPSNRSGSLPQDCAAAQRYSARWPPLLESNFHEASTASASCGSAR